MPRSTYAAAGLVVLAVAVLFALPLDVAATVYSQALGRLASSRTATLSCTPAAIASLSLGPGVTIRSVTQIPLGGTYGQSRDEDPAFPTNGTELPALCALYVNVISSDTSSYNFGLFLPVHWNQRFLATGNGGFGGGVDWPDLGYFARYGFASMSTDTGHLAAAFDGSWAVNDPEAVTDWGYRAMHGSVVLAKTITALYYGEAIHYSYYAGCSTGGRQGLKEVQMFPHDFDGVLAGAPAWWTTHLQSWSLWVGLYNLPSTAAHHIPAELMVGAVHDEIVRQCDPQDGLVDHIISDPYGCNFFAEALLCSATAHPRPCLSAAQVPTLRKLYSDWVDTNQTLVFPSYALGSELQNTFLFNVTSSSGPSPAGTSYIANFLYNVPALPASFDWAANFSYDVTVRQADAVNPGHANADAFDISAFHAAGGKLIMYHGMADGLIPTGSSIYFYQQVLAALSQRGLSLRDVASFCRLFLVPGMGHCAGSAAGTDAPCTFGGVAQSTYPALIAPTNATYGVPGYQDRTHDALRALMAWVEHAQPPDLLIATKFANDTVAHGVRRQRPLCPYPEQAKYSGQGDPDQAANWNCTTLW